MKPQVKRIFPKEENFFFGYYSNSPWNKDGTKVLGTKSAFIDKTPSKNDKLEILFKDTITNETHKIGETKTWCWQQGCMLQWFGPDYNSNIIYNDFQNNKYVSKILNLKTRKEKIINFPVFSVSKNGEFALSLNFSRLNDLREGYGYKNLEDKNKNKKYPTDDGIFLIDLKKNKQKLIISLEDLYNYKTLASMNQGKHWIDHLELSPNAKRFCFLHRWEIGGGLFHTRLFSSDLTGKDLHLFADSGFYSHITWKNDDSLFGYASMSEKFGNVRTQSKRNPLLKILIFFYKRLLPRRFKRGILPVSYYILKDKGKKGDHLKINIENEDGHGTWSPDEKTILTDTYPNKKGFRKLLVFNPKNNKKFVLGNFYSIPKIENLPVEDYGNSSIRCDLHPRWDFKGTKVCIDSVHEGKRNMYEIDFKKELLN